MLLMYVYNNLKLNHKKTEPEKEASVQMNT